MFNILEFLRRPKVIVYKVDLRLAYLKYEDCIHISESTVKEFLAARNLVDELVVFEKQKQIENYQESIAKLEQQIWELRSKQ